ncbi:carbohydrate ABC transporter permease [Blautia sp. HCP3S3_G3]|uniref:carbohydrate ABC transporter permease n=1 Tax=Blautia sp. HCP3S3_G3 TaxID=3438913 RepID=UPI003F8A5845
MQKKKTISHILIIICCTILACIFIFPILLLFINSFKSLKEIYMSVLQLPKTLNLDNYISAFEELDYLGAIRNSLIVTCTVTTANIICCSMAAWVLVRYKTRISTFIFTMFSVAVLIPFQCVMLPLLTEMGILNMINMPGLMLVNLGFGSSMSIILFHGFIKNVPVELEEAAAIDGASQPRIFFTIVLPLIKGIAVTVAILNVMSLWNDYLLPSLTINKRGTQTLPLRTYLFFGAYTKKWNLGAAALIMAMIPIVIFYVACQKHIIKGVTEGAVKG